MTIKQQLTEAHQLIKAQQYQKARAILIHLDHPLAREWLDKIDTLDKPRKANSPIEMHEVNAWIEQQKERKPWHPIRFIGLVYGGLIALAVSRWIFFIQLSDTYELGAENLDFLIPAAVLEALGIGWLGFLISGLMLAYNWHLLARTKWMLVTILGWVVLLIGLPGSVIIYASILESNQPLVYVFAMMLMAITLGFQLVLPFVIVVMQHEGYMVWKQQGYQTLRQHRYNWEKAWIGLIGAATISIALGLLIYIPNPPYALVQYEGVSFTVPRTWKQLECDPNLEEAECIAEFQFWEDGPDPVFSAYRTPRAEGEITSVDVEEMRRDGFFASTPKTQMKAWGELTVGGLPASYRDTSRYDQEAACAYVEGRRIYVVHGDWVYHFHLYACAMDWYDYLPKLDIILNTVRFN